MPDPEILTRRDPLTGFHTKEALLEYLNSKVTSLYSPSKYVSVLVMDLDNFKGINDTYGHLAGDDAIKFFAAAINNALKGQHFVARYGGDEFVVIMDDAANGKESVDVANRIKISLAQERFKVTAGSIKINTSIGIASYPHDAKTTKELIEAADKALYYVKKHGRGRIVSSRHLKGHSIKDKIVLGFKLCAATGAVAIIFFSYTGSGALKDVIGYWRNNYYFALYQLHANVSGANYYQFFLKGDKKMTGWVVYEGGDAFFLSLIKPVARFNPFFIDHSLFIQPVKIPKSMVESSQKTIQ